MLFMALNILEYCHKQTDIILSIHVDDQFISFLIVLTRGVETG